MAISKVVYGGQTLIDLTGDTVTAEKVLAGYTAHAADGSAITGTSPFDVDSSGATAAVAEVLKGKTFAKGGAVLTGTMPNIGKQEIAISTVIEAPKISQGYHDGSGTAQIAEAEKAKIVAENIREGVTILGVTGSMSGTEGANPQAKTVTPSTAQQDVLPDTGYNYLSQVTVMPIPYVETDNAAGGKTVTIA